MDLMFIMCTQYELATYKFMEKGSESCLDKLEDMASLEMTNCLCLWHDVLWRVDFQQAAMAHDQGC
jgi:hypothetical protein